MYHTLPKIQMALADTLSCRNDIDTTQDNTNVQLLPLNAFNQQLQAINVAPADKIKDSSSSDLLILQAIHQMKKELPLFNRSKAEDWTFNDGHLYYKTHLYILEAAHHDLVATAHSFFKGGHGSHLHTIALLSKDYWWPGVTLGLDKNERRPCRVKGSSCNESIGGR